MHQAKKKLEPCGGRLFDLKMSKIKGNIRGKKVKIALYVHRGLFNKCGPTGIRYLTYKSNKHNMAYNI